MTIDVKRAGAILAVSDVERSLAFYRDRLGFEVEARYDDPPYATLAHAGDAPLARRAGACRRGPPGRRDDGPGATARRLAAILVVEVEDCLAELRGAAARRACAFLRRAVRAAVGRRTASSRVDPDGYLVELEQPA